MKHRLLGQYALLEKELSAEKRSESGIQWFRQALELSKTTNEPIDRPSNKSVYIMYIYIYRYIVIYIYYIIYIET